MTGMTGVLQNGVLRQIPGEDLQPLAGQGGKIPAAGGQGQDLAVQLPTGDELTVPAYADQITGRAGPIAAQQQAGKAVALQSVALEVGGVVIGSWNYPIRTTSRTS